jgi:Ca-activated chloride channel family protein
LFFLCLAILGLRAQDKVPQFRTDASAVTLDVRVTDANGRPVIYLQQSDFQIYEDGQKQELRYFATVEAPWSILLMFDITGLMDSQAPFMQQGMNMFFGNLRAQDRVSVAVFGPDFETLVNFRTLDKDKPFAVKLPKMRVPTNLYAALEFGTKKIANEKSRKAVIVMTDGRETFLFNQTLRLGKVLTLAEDADFQESVRNLRKRGVPLYIIALDTDPRYLAFDYEYAYLKNDYPRTDAYRNGLRSRTIAEDFLSGIRLRLERFAEVTGGRILYPRTLNEVAQLYEQVSRELGYTYTLGYSLKNTKDDGKFHRIDVRVRDESLKVIQSRDGYGGN